MSHQQSSQLSRRNALILAGSTAAGLVATTAVGASATAPPAHARMTSRRGRVFAAADDLSGPGPYQVTTKSIPAKEVKGFGGATMYYPQNPAEGATYGIVVTFPGFVEPGVTLKTVAERFASHGFLVFAAEAFVTAETPEVRAIMITAALEEAKRRPEWSAIADVSRVGLVGHSMGGGGALIAGEKLDVSGVIGIHPWAERGFPGLTAPTMIIGGSWDNIAPVDQYAVPIYRSLTSSREKGLLVRHLGTHWAGVVDDARILPRMTAFLKLYVDGNESYRPLYVQKALPLTTWEATAR